MRDLKRLRRPERPWRLATVAAATLLCAPLSDRSAAAAGPGGHQLRVLSQKDLPAPVVWAFDVRWSEDGKLVVAAGRDGLFEIALDSGDATPRSVAGSEGLGYASHVALSPGHLTAAASFGPFGWRSREGNGEWHRDVPMSVVLDMDVGNGEVLFLGGRRVTVAGQERPQWAPDGGILFAAPIENGRLGPLTQRLTARSGPAGKAIEMARCHVLEVGALRLLSGGRYVVIPGVQPGILLYDAQGRLMHAWGTTDLGIYDQCDLTDREADDVAADIGNRIDWWQRHAVLDDVVPWGQWFALIVRTPVGRGARWHLVPFGEDGAQTALPLPVNASTPGVHLRADSRGERLALLLIDYEERAQAPLHPPRMVIVHRGGP